MGKRKTNWDRLQNRPIDQTTANRDVYESQQLERGRLGKRQGMLTRTIFSVFFGIFIGVLMYCALSVVGGLLGSFLSFGDSGTEGVQQEAEISEVNEAVLAGMKPLSEAPTDVTLDELKAEYLLYVASDASTADMTGYYLDTEGNTYSESELPGLLSSIAAGEFLSETAQYDRYLDGLRAGNEYGVLPLSIAPMNIEYNDFVRLYFMDLSSGSLIHRYADFEGNEYSSEEVQELYFMVQAGTLGSGEISYQTADGGSPSGTVSTGEAKRRSWFAPTLQKMLLSFVTGLFSGLVMLLYMRRNLDAQNLLNDTTDINQYENDQHIQLPEELQRNYDWFPDVGAHSRVQVSSMLSHMALSNKGLNKIRVTRRAKEDILDEDGNILYLKGEPLVDDNDVVITDLLPAIDEAFMDELFTVSGIPKEEKKLRKRYDATKIPYNPGNQNREKLKGFNTVADLINGDWKLPAYETQRPAGAYIVDTEPVNTMVLAITRAGKGWWFGPLTHLYRNQRGIGYF